MGSGKAKAGAGTGGRTAEAAGAEGEEEEAASASSTNATALTWAAAAAARALTAAAHRLAAWESIRRASGRMADAAAAGRDAMVAGGGAIGHDGRVSNAEPANAAALLRDAARAQRRAGDAFGEAAAQARSAAAEFDMAAAACAMAGDTRGERAFRGRAGRARAMAQDAGKEASLACRDARETLAMSRSWKTGAALRLDGAVWQGDRDSWKGGQAIIHADAEHDREVWSGEARRAAAAVQKAVEHMWKRAAAAERAAVAAGEAGGLADVEAAAAASATEGGGSVPGARDAAAAWRDAMAAARNAPDACRPRARRADAGRRAADRTG